MKQSDIFSLILVAGIGTLAAFLICNKLMGDPNMAKTEFKELKYAVTSDLQAPDAEVYNIMSLNPTIEVYVGDCVDIDQNGILDTAELVACGKKDASEVEGEGEDGSDEGSSDSEGE